MDRNPDPDTPLNDTSATPHSERTTVRDFIRNARDPVNAIIGVGEILGQSDLTPDQQECLALINASAQTLKRLFKTEELRNWQDRPREELHVLNYQGLLNRTGDKIAVAEEVLEHIQESLPELVARCRNALELNNMEELRQAAHTIKGSAGTAGAEIVADRASQINRTIRKGVSDREVLVGFVDELEKEAVVFLNLLMHTHRQDNT
ncbi:MAG: Hpt domain-containing protein [Spirochaeta sp.]|jgi:HPt (histidine-containing phosphotransfer) domain-containing protein|nr:Hpt domain-containing protein [Spirochaeta sp.]